MIHHQTSHPSIAIHPRMNSDQNIVGIKTQKVGLYFIWMHV